MAISVPASVVLGMAAAAVLVVRLRGSRRYSAGYIDGLTQRAKFARSEK